MGINIGYGASSNIVSQYGINQTSTPFLTMQNAGAISGVAGAISSIFAGQTQAIGYKMEEAARKAQAQQAISMAKLNNLKLSRNYNETTAKQATMFTAQNRSFSSGSVVNILNQDKSNLEWDKEYMKLSGEYQQAGILADAVGSRAAASAATTGGYTRGLMQIASTAIDYGKIK